MEGRGTQTTPFECEHPPLPSHLVSGLRKAQWFGLQDPSRLTPAWLWPADENGPYFLALREMIEEMYQLYGGPVVLVAHSMGNMYTLYFLQRQPQAWKDKYIRAFVSLGAPWGGVAKTLRVLASGKTLPGPVWGAVARNSALSSLPKCPRPACLMSVPRCVGSMQIYP